MSVKSVHMYSPYATVTPADTDIDDTSTALVESLANLHVSASITHNDINDVVDVVKDDDDSYNNFDTNINTSSIYDSSNTHNINADDTCDDGVKLCTDGLRSDVDVSSSVCLHTGLVYDVRMTAHKNPTAHHPEQPLRIVNIFEQLMHDGIVSRCIPLASRRATLAELAVKHSERHIMEVLSFNTKSMEELVARAHSLDSVYLCPSTTEAALLSAGSVISATEAVMKGTVRNAVAVVRPPGHHSERDSAEGFCIFNNVAVAVAAAQNSMGARRVLIVDWDVHHGNGTMRLFEDDPTVFYFSVHRYDNGTFYPETNYGRGENVGVGDGMGRSMNVAWNSPGGKLRDADYIAAWRYCLLPAAVEFNPDLVFICAGFDAARGDPLGRCLVTPEGYAHLTHMLLGLAQGRMVVALEGGYNLNSISNSMSAVAGVLVGNSVPPLENPEIGPCDAAIDAIRTTIRAHYSFWECFRTLLAVTEGLVDLPTKPVPVDSGPVSTRTRQSNRRTVSQSVDKAYFNSGRAKFFYFDQTTKLWSQLGDGMVRILLNDDTGVRTLTIVLARGNTIVIEHTMTSELVMVNAAEAIEWGNDRCFWANDSLVTNVKTSNALVWEVSHSLVSIMKTLPSKEVPAFPVTLAARFTHSSMALKLQEAFNKVVTTAILFDQRPLSVVETVSTAVSSMTV